MLLIRRNSGYFYLFPYTVVISLIYLLLSAFVT